MSPLPLDIYQLLARMEGDRDITTQPPTGLPQIPSELVLPADVEAFYKRFGGAVLFPEAMHPIKIVAPSDFVRGNPVITGLGIDDLNDEDDPSHNWFIVAHEGGTQYVTIDLNPQRHGRCYDSFWDCHAMRGSCDVIARSFTEFLLNYIESRGKGLYWLHSADWHSLGDAYD